MLTRIKELIDNRHQNAIKWKEEGGKKIIGYLCTYTPEEIIHAAGAVPVRIVGSGEPISLADGHVQTFYCTYSRGFLDECFKGNYDYLDGLTGGYSCDHYHTAFEIWQRNRPVDFHHMVDMPSRVDTPEARKFFIEELKIYRAKTAQALGIDIDDDALLNSIKVYNTSRTLLKRLFDLRKADPSPITGTEALEAILSSMYTPKEEHNKVMEELLSQIEGREAFPKDPPRLMVIGSELDDAKVYGLIEELGALVVTDDICTGTRYMWDLASEEGDPLEAIADRYLDKIPCPVKHPIDARLDHITAMVKEYDVAAVVVIQRKFCNPHEWDNPRLFKFLKGLNLPYTMIELDTTYMNNEIQSKVQGLIDIVRG